MGCRICVLVGFLVAGLAAASLAVRGGERVLYRGESDFNTILVTEDEDGLRTLRFEQWGARQSVVKVGDPDHLELPYTKAMPIGLLLARDPQRVLIVGLGGGTIPMFLHKHFPDMTIDVVEIDRQVVHVARRFFGVEPDKTLHTHVADGRKFIEGCREPYDVIFLDAFGADNVPYDLTTREFLQAARRAVTPTGLVVGNIWSRSSNQLYDRMIRTYLDVFDELYVVDVRDAGNKILLALPRPERVKRLELARRARRLSRQHAFGYDLGEIVTYGFREPGRDGARARVLTDRRKQRRAG